MNGEVLIVVWLLDNGFVCMIYWKKKCGFLIVKFNCININIIYIYYKIFIKEKIR